MSKISTLKKLLKEDKRQVLVAIYNNIVHTGITNYLSDETYLKLTYRIRFGKKLDINNPKTFNEKLQWLKLHDNNTDYITMVDKVLVKDYVAKIIGYDYIIPTLGVWDSFDEIDFEALPNQFVLKCNHDSGSVVICKDKSTFNIDAARKKISKGLKTDAFYWGREWPYKYVKRKILAEKYMTDNSNSSQLTDYKVYTFNGRAKMIMINKDRGVDTKADYFDTDYQCLDFSWGYPHAEVKPQKPKCFDEMIELAEKLAKDTYELRVDFYEVNGQIYFGELTFFDGSGFDKIEPIEWDYKIGSWVKLPIGMEDIN